MGMMRGNGSVSVQYNGDNRNLKKTRPLACFWYSVQRERESVCVCGESNMKVLGSAPRSVMNGIAHYDVQYPSIFLFFFEKKRKKRKERKKEERERKERKKRKKEKKERKERKKERKEN